MSEAHPHFSVVIPTYNRAKFLPKALDSVWRQTFNGYEVIVVDDGSTDGTLEYLRSLSGPIRILSQYNGGPGVARNFGAKQARGRYIAFLDSDDLWFPWTLSCFAELISRNNDPAILSARLMEFADDAELSYVENVPGTADVFGDFFSASGKGYFVGAGMSVIRRDVFLKVNGYTRRRINGEDHDLIMRIGAERGFVQVTAPYTLGWRQHDLNETKDLRRSVEGCLYLVSQEQRGEYPGGSTLARKRREIIARHTRPVTLACLRRGLWRDAWRLYRSTFAWNASSYRLMYLGYVPASLVFFGLRGGVAGAFGRKAAR